MKLKALAVLAGVLAALFTAPANAATPAACSAYTYVGGGSLCADFPGSSDRDCDEVKYRVTVGAWDPWRLDGSGAKKGDGIGCEANPVKPRPTVAPTTVPPATTAPPTEPAATTAPPATTPAATTAPSTTAPTTVPPSTTRPPAEETEPAAEPTATRTTEPAGPALPVTGPAAPALIGIGIAVLAGGAGAIFLARRRRTRFEA